MISAKLLLAYILQTGAVGMNIDPSVIDIEQAYCLAKNIYYEAGGESTRGQIAVASVTLNRVNDPRFPDTVCDVVKQSIILKNSKKRICAFSWYCEKDIENIDVPIRRKDGSINEQVYKKFQEVSILAIKILSGKVKDNTSGATHFYNPSLAQPAWADELRLTATIGNHNFHKLPNTRK